MAKELPYFKFEPAEYLTKDISFCSLSAQGLFMNICSYYWQRNCKLTKSQLLKRLNYETELNELIQEGVIDLDNENIIIKFLDLQLEEVVKTSNKNSKNGAKGGRPKKANKNPKESETKPTALISLSETKGIREDKIILDEIKEENIDVLEKADEIFLKVRDNYKIYAEQLYKDPVFRQSIAIEFMKGKKEDVIKPTIHKYLKLYLNRLDQDKKIHNNKRDFMSHFPNWLRKQTITFVLPKKKPIRYA